MYQLAQMSEGLAKTNTHRALSLSSSNEWGEQLTCGIVINGITQSDTVLEKKNIFRLWPDVESEDVPRAPTTPVLVHSTPEEMAKQYVTNAPAFKSITTRKLAAAAGAVLRFQDFTGTPSPTHAVTETVRQLLLW